MVILPGGTILLLLKVFIVVSICLLVALLSWRLLFTNFRLFPSLRNVKIRYLVLVAIVGPALCFVSLVVVLKLVAQEDIWALTRSLQNANKLHIFHTYHMEGEDVNEEILITDTNKIRNLYGLMSNAKYKRVYRPGKPMMIFASVGVGVYEKEKLLYGFTVYGDMLVTYPEVHQYPSVESIVADTNLKVRQYEASDADITSHIRQALGLKY